MNFEDTDTQEILVNILIFHYGLTVTMIALTYIILFLGMKTFSSLN